MSAGLSEWPMGEAHNGHPIKVCTCAEGAYIGARRCGTPDCCERCGYMTPAQWTYIADHFDSEAALRLAEAEQRGARAAVYEAGLWCGECDPADQHDGCCVLQPPTLRALVAQQHDGGGSE